MYKDFSGFVNKYSDTVTLQVGNGILVISPLTGRPHIGQDHHILKRKATVAFFKI